MKHYNLAMSLGEGNSMKVLRNFRLSSGMGKNNKFTLLGGTCIFFFKKISNLGEDIELMSQRIRHKGVGLPNLSLVFKMLKC